MDPNKTRLAHFHEKKVSFSPAARAFIPIEKDIMWISDSHTSLYKKSRNGMIQYNYRIDKIMKIIEYPEYVEPWDHSCTLSQDGMIYIVEGQDKVIVSFNPKLNTFGKGKSLPEDLGSYLNSFSIFGRIHIFNGSENLSHYIIYDPKKNKLIDHKVDAHKIAGAATLLYNDRVMVIGGYDWNTEECMDEVLMSSIITENQVYDIPKFEIKPKWTLPIPLCSFGHIIYQDYVVIFGGLTTGKVFIDSIYLLHLNNARQGWRKLSHIKCPMASQYMAVLTHDEDVNVHLFATKNLLGNWKESKTGNYTMPLKTIIGPEYVEFDLSILKVIDGKTISIVNGYVWNEQQGMIQTVPQEIIDICIIYYFFLTYV